MSIDELTLMELEMRNLALNELLDRTILGLPTDMAELRKTLKLHYLRKVLEIEDIPQRNWQEHIQALQTERPNETRDLDPQLVEWVTNHLYHPRNVIAIVTRNLTQSEKAAEAQIDNAEYFDRMAQAVIEYYPKQISGLTTGFNKDGMTLPQADFLINEKYGRLIDKFLQWWYGANALSVDVMFFEPDPTHTKVVAAWKGVNMRPAYYSGIQSYRTMSERSGSASGTTLSYLLNGEHWIIGDTAEREAQTLLDSLNLAAANPYDRADFVSKISDELLNTNRP
ncbi:hypothetical protein [Burkholderia phage FLC9]|nr:hypothetical protein [Burkholderia phage FLC9]